MTRSDMTRSDTETYDMETSDMDTSGEKTELAKAVMAKKAMATQDVAGGSSDSSTTSSLTTSRKTSREGFTGANINFGESSLYNLNDNQPVDTSSWSAQNMTVTPGQPLSAGVKQFLARKPQQLPLPEGEMLMFANTEFKGECCPNAYSTSNGCACMTGPQYNYLITRGGNNVPYSEY